jgi:hypothetical protein
VVAVLVCRQTQHLDPNREHHERDLKVDGLLPVEGLDRGVRGGVEVV